MQPRYFPAGMQRTTTLEARLWARRLRAFSIGDFPSSSGGMCIRPSKVWARRGELDLTGLTEGRAECQSWLGYKLLTTEVTEKFRGGRRVSQTDTTSPCAVSRAILFR